MEIPAQKRIVRMCETRKRMVGCSGFPRFNGMARKRVTACDEQVGHGANASNSNNTCFRSTDVDSGYTFEA